MEPIFTKSYWENWFGAWLTRFSGLQLSKEGYFQAGPGNLGHFGGPQKRGICSNLYFTSDGDFW